MIAKDKKKGIRAAIYTRVSTEEGLGQEFNSLDAQRDACHAFIKSQKGQGWQAIAPTFDDGGFSGANLKRPGLSRLLEEIEAGHIDCVVTYKVDRLSRSLLDFVRLMEVFERHNVAYVSVTQQINSSTSMGRLLFNLLLSFAEFEREQIAERTRDKMRAAKRRGKWIGGRPPLGYDIDPKDKKLVINPAEATTVREIFRIYSEERSIASTLRMLRERGIHSKRWLTKSGKPYGGEPFSKTSLNRLLTNPVYLGKVSLDNEVFDGEHQAIVNSATFDETRAILTKNLRHKKNNKESKHNPILKSLLFCSSCNRAMIHASTKKSENRTYRYYVCGRAMKEGWNTCPSPSVPALQIESFVVDQIGAMGNDTEVIRKTHEQLVRLTQDHMESAKERKEHLRQSIQHHQALIQDALVPDARSFHQSQIEEFNGLIAELDTELESIKAFNPTRQSVSAALSEFGKIWEATANPHRINLLQQIVEKIEYGGADGELEIFLKPTGIKALATDEESQPQLN